MNWTPSLAFLLSMMWDLAGVEASASLPNVLEGIYCGLYQAPTPFPTSQLTIADITECDYDGYGRQAVSWFPPFIDPSGPVDLAARNMHFVPTDSNNPNTATGAFLVSAAAAESSC